MSSILKNTLRNYIPQNIEIEHPVNWARIYDYNNKAIQKGDIVYLYDAPSANGYVGILWAIGGLHDRGFVSHPVTGKIRRMTYESMKKKYELSGYIEKYLQ